MLTLWTRISWRIGHRLERLGLVTYCNGGHFLLGWRKTDFEWYCRGCVKDLWGD